MDDGLTNGIERGILDLLRATISPVLLTSLIPGLVTRQAHYLPQPSVITPA